MPASWRGHQSCAVKDEIQTQTTQSQQGSHLGQPEATPEMWKPSKPTPPTANKVSPLHEQLPIGIYVTPMNPRDAVNTNNQ